MDKYKELILIELMNKIREEISDMFTNILGIIYEIEIKNNIKKMSKD